MTREPALDTEASDEPAAAQLLLPPPLSARAALETEPWPDGAAEPSEVNGSRGSDVQEWLREFHRSALTVFDEQLKRALIRQGAAPDALAGPELSVSLDDISIVDWIQAIQLFAKHAVVTVTHDDTESRIWCSNGALIDAESGPLRGEAAVYRIIGLEKGQVVTELRRVRRARKIRSSTQAILLEAARRKDESGILRNRIGDLERHFRPKELDPRQRSLNTDETAVLRAFEGPRRLGDVLEQSELGDIETLMAIESLIRSGHIVEAVVDAPRSTRVPPSPPAIDKPERLPASVPPFSFAWPPEPKPAHGTARWVLSTVVMALVVSAAAWLGAMDSRNRSSVAAALTPAVSPAPSRDPGSYPVAVRVVPADATLEVDGRRIGTGSWTTRLPRDGMLHELRISAEGFVPARILFVDTAPPLDVRLDPLPLAPVAEAAPDLPEAAPAQRESVSPSPRRKSWSRKSAGAARAATDASPEPAPRPSSPKRKPYVQLIDAEAAGAATATQ